MGYRINSHIDSTDTIAKRLGINDDGSVTKYARDDMDRLMNPYIPFKTGTLRRQKTYPNNHTIKYTSPYAHYQYYGKAMVAQNGSAWAKKGEIKHYSGKSLSYHSSGTGANWDDVMLQKRGKDLEKDIQNFVKRGGK